jgi:hypothetical protein
MTKTTRTRWMLLTVMALGVITLAYFGSRLRVSYRTPLSGCARDAGTGGASGIYHWTEQIGIPVKLLAAPIWEAPQQFEAKTGQCLLTTGNGPWAPTGADLDVQKWHTLREWLSLGNTLIVVTSAPRTLPDVLRKDLIASTFEQTGTEAGSTWGEGWATNIQPETARTSISDGGSLTVAMKGPRWTVSAPKEKDKGVATATPDASKPKPKSDINPQQWQLAGDAAGGVLFRIPVGNGAIYFLLDSFAWTNTGFDQGDNARVLARILQREVPDGVLGIDEYRHGHGRRESFLAYLLYLPGSSAVLWLMVIWGVLYLFGRNVRLRPAEQYFEPERRTAQEYIDAVAQLYQRARAAPLVVEAVARRLRQLSRSSAEHPAAVLAILERAQVFSEAAERPAVPTAGIHLVTELIQLRKEIYGTRTLS